MPEYDNWSTVTTATFGAHLDGLDLGRFTSIKGLELSIETVEMQDGGAAGPTTRSASKVSYPEIELTRPISKDDSLQKWVDGYARGGEDGSFPRYTGEIVLFSGDLKRLRSWTFEGAFPVRWSVTDFSADSEAGVVYETIVLAHEGWRF